MDETRRTLITILRQFAPWITGSDEDFPMDSEMQTMGLDSMSAVSLIFELEAAFDITFTDEFLTYEVFRAPATIESAVHRLLASSSVRPS